jgi:hypothetical protein
MGVNIPAGSDRSFGLRDPAPREVDTWKADPERFRSSLARHAAVTPRKPAEDGEETSGVPSFPGPPVPSEEAAAALPSAESMRASSEAAMASTSAEGSAAGLAARDLRGAASGLVISEAAGQGVGDLALHTAFAERLALSQKSGETIVTFSDARSSAREAIVVHGANGEVSLSLSLRDQSSNSGNEASEELRRRLEARGLSIGRIDIA